MPFQDRNVPTLYGNPFDTVHVRCRGCQVGGRGACGWFSTPLCTQEEPNHFDVAVLCGAVERGVPCLLVRFAGPSWVGRQPVDNVIYPVAGYCLQPPIFHHREEGN